MLQWRNRKKSRMTLPPWLEGAPVYRQQTNAGDIVTLSKYSETCGDYPGCAWHKVSDEWEVSSMRAVDFLPFEWLRDNQRWGVVVSKSLTSGRPVDLVDGRGRLWVVPALLHPETGLPVVVQSRRLTADGWVRECVREDIQRAIVAAQEARQWHIETGIALADASQQQDWICTILESLYHLDAMSLGVMGIIDDQLAISGLIACCGLPLDGLTEEPSDA